MIDGLETNKLISAAAGIRVATILQTPGEVTADSAMISPYVLCLPVLQSVILLLKSVIFSVLLVNAEIYCLFPCIHSFAFTWTLLKFSMTKQRALNYLLSPIML